MSLFSNVLRSVPVLLGTLFIMNACSAPAPTALRGDDQTESKPKKKAPPKEVPADDDDGAPSGGNSGGNQNPTPQDGAPTLSGVDPAAVTIGSSPNGLTLKLTGTRFAAGSQVDLAGTKLPATLRAPTELEVQVPGNVLSSSGVLRLTVLVPSKGESNPLTFTVANPTSVSISTLQPTSAIVGSNNVVTLTVRGSGFINSSVVRFNGAALSTTFRSSTELAAQLPSNALLSAGRVGVTVSSGNDVVSLPSAFEIRNPQPQATNLSPRTVDAGSGSIVVTIDGNGFSRSSEVIAGNAPLATTFVSTQRLRATVPSSLLGRSGTLRFTVTNAAPGGGTSTAPTFTIAQATQQTACTYYCSDYGYVANECYDGWSCNGATGCLYQDVCGAGGGGGGGGNAACVYSCDAYGYTPGQCYNGWYCIPNGEYSGCLGQTTC